MQLGARFIRTSSRTNRGFTALAGINQLFISSLLYTTDSKVHQAVKYLAPVTTMALCRNSNMQQVLHLWHYLATTTNLAQNADASQPTACQHTRFCRLACSFPLDYAIFVTYHEPGKGHQCHHFLILSKAHQSCYANCHPCVTSIPCQACFPLETLPCTGGQTISSCACKSAKT